MKKMLFLICSLSLGLQAHFGIIIPSNNIIQNQQNSEITLTYAFMHPFEQSYMKMEKPLQVGVFSDGKIIDLTKTISKKNDIWISKFELPNPAVYQFFVKPVPYFEKSESKFIQHLTKTIVDGFGANEDWDKPIGLKAEIIPLSRPYGLYEGNLFRGKVLYNGKIAKNCEVEVEFYNDKNLKAKSDLHVTQVVKTDENGIFAFSMPKSGWWGFSALLEDEKTMKKDGKDYAVELGAVIWIKVDKW